tara:strand:- start:1120 stop:1377 length:258 start_codon:yes stop_codon:yes gene_type:complete
MEGPALRARSILSLIKMMGVVEPIIADIATAKTIPIPTVRPRIKEVPRIGPDILAMMNSQSNPKIRPFKILTHISLMTTVRKLSA